MPPRLLPTFFFWTVLSISSYNAHSQDIERIIDRNNLLNVSKRKNLEGYIDKALGEHDIDLRIVIGSGFKDINGFSNEYFRTESVGLLSQKKQGLLLVIDTQKQLTRLEVGRILEPVYTDIFVGFVQDHQMAPFFKAKRIADGLLALTEHLVTRAQEAENGKQFVPPVGYLEGSAGAGAKSSFAQENGGQLDKPEQKIDAHPNPEGTVQSYLHALETQNRSPDLPIYTAATQQMLKKWVVTPAQMKNLLKAYQKCGASTVHSKDNLAVVRYRIKERQCSPWLLVKSQGLWRLDLLEMQRLFSFNHKNQWRLRQNLEHLYSFAFTDWQFDKHGFPLRKTLKEHD